MFVAAVAYDNIFVEKSNKVKHKHAETIKTILFWGFIASLVWLVEKFFFQTFAVCFIILFNFKYL